MKQDKLMRLKTVLTEKIQKSRAWWYKEIKEGRAPKPIKVGRSSLWSEIEIDAYIEQLKKGEGA